MARRAAGRGRACSSNHSQPLTGRRSLLGGDAPLDPPPSHRDGGGGPCAAWWSGRAAFLESSGTVERQGGLHGGRPLHRLRRSPSPASQGRIRARRPHKPSARPPFSPPGTGWGAARRAVGGVRSSKAASDEISATGGAVSVEQRGARIECGGGCPPAGTPPTTLRVVLPPRAGEGKMPPVGERCARLPRSLARWASTCRTIAS